MEEATLGLDLPLPPTGLYERLAQVKNYTWDFSQPPWHSSYDHFHVYGVYNKAAENLENTFPSASTFSTRSGSSNRSSPQLRPNIRHHWSSISGASTDSEISSSRADPESLWTPVVARVSTHIMRLEREYKYNKSIIKHHDNDCERSIRPIDIFRLPSSSSDAQPILVCVYESPGPNYLKDLTDFGPAFYGLKSRRSSLDANSGSSVSVQTFLDFAVGACECLELLHHGVNTVHGEIRQESFHWNKETNKIAIVNFGNGPRAYENILSSEGWATLNKEVDAKNKLQFIAPEQTGRLPAEPDSRTDIYSLGVLFWVLLVGRPAFDGDTPLDIIQKVLSSRLPTISSIRMDVPDAISRVVAKMTSKQMDERYNSVNGLKHDLNQLHKFLGEGEQDNIENYVIGQRDVSVFFILPSMTFGNHAEQEKVTKVIRRMHKRNTSGVHKNGYHNMYSATSNSSISESRVDGTDLIDGSDTSSSVGVRDSRSNSTTIGLEAGSIHSRPHIFAGGRSLLEARTGSLEGSDRDSQFSGPFSSPFYESIGPVGRLGRKNSHKTKKKGKTEVILVVGAPGVGKTTLLKAVQPTVRRYGYFASSRFDRARPTPFEPMLKMMSSLFRQIFSEKDVGTPYHEVVRSHVQPLWAILHSILDLPESLLDPSFPTKKLLTGADSSTLRTEDPLSTPTSANGNLPVRDANDFLRGPSSTRSIRLMTTYMDVLRVICAGKVICLSLDDLHSADDESAELLSNIIKARIPVVLLIACRHVDSNPTAHIRDILNLDGCTRLELQSLTEKQVFEYVATTMSQDEEAIIPLAAVINEKSDGNPFVMKEILQSLHQRNCLWYDWKSSGWQYDLDKVFDQLSTEGCQGEDFIARRLTNLQPSARCILAWASLIGDTFSYTLIQKLLGGEYLIAGGDCDGRDATCKQKGIFNESECMDGMQSLLTAGIIVPGETDDEYRFSHSRMLKAANEMRECSKVEAMHFIISQALLSYLSECRYTLYPLARHICLASDIVKNKIKIRVRHRDVLWRGARKAQESGAKATALLYYQNCIKLMQDDPWDDSMDDVYHDETLQVFVNTAELYYLHGEYDEALKLLAETFKHASCAADKTRSYLLRGKIHRQKGEYHEAFCSLKECLSDLGVKSLTQRSWDECDIELKKLEFRIRNMDRTELILKPLSEDKTLIALGTVLAETLAAVYWHNSLMWYQVLIIYIQTDLDRGRFVQSGLGYTMLCSAAVGRFKDLELGLLFGEISRELYQIYDDPWTLGRGWTLYSSFVAHFQTPMRNILPVLDNALEYTLTSGDRATSIMNLGTMALARFGSGQDLAEIEAFCTYGPEEFKNWEFDVRGGSMIIAVKQLVRALQGKTFIDNVDTLLDDEHVSREAWLKMCSSNHIDEARSQDMWSSITAAAYYAYGHYDYVIEMGRKMRGRSLEALWTHRAAASTRFYTALSLLQLAKSKAEDERAQLVAEAYDLQKHIDSWGEFNDVNYFAWSKIISAEIGHVTGDYEQAGVDMEMAVDHAQIHGFAVEEAIAIELGAEFLMARGVKRAAKVMVQEAISAWNRINATGKAKQLYVKHEWLLKTATTSRTTDMAVQTEPLTALVATDDPGLHTQRDYTSRWVDPKPSSPTTKSQDVPGLGLDILDLTSILEFSRVISSELQVNSLLHKMTSVILESVGGQAEFCAIVIDSEDQGWCVAASGDQEQGVKTYPDGIPFSEVDDQVAQQITHYIIRTKETVFVQNILEDERFSNVNEGYLQRNPQGRSIICIPIVQADHLMGVIHLEGRPNAFTQRNMVVLNLLTTQVSISLGNALLYRKVRKVSSANASMVESQKRALAAAREAEAKAKAAEAEAMHNVKLKEEAAKAKSIFLANVSHELRTPLNGVIGMSELLKGTPLSKDQEGYADSIRVCADALLTVINDILDFSKLEAGKMQMFIVPLNLKETITEVVRALAYTNQEHGLETIEDLALDDYLVLGDPVRLHQIFMNLLSNAYKFTPNGSVTVKARKTSETGDKIKVTCSVADTGIGITEEQLTRLFQPFSQADSSTARSYGGSGLGLSICKAMIENVLGGKIWIESKPGVGTTVSFSLTFQKAPKDSSVPQDMKISAKDPDPMANWSQSASPGNDSKASFCDLSQVPREELRVCIAEDNPINRKIAVSFVKKLGLKCDAYEDGKLAYEALQKKSKEGSPYHLVLMDVQMPVLDGYEATKAIRKDTDSNVNQILVIALTASAIRGDREKCLEAGMNDYLAKPVRQVALKAMLDGYLNKTQAAMQTITNGSDKKATVGDQINGTNGNSTSTEMEEDAKETASSPHNDVDKTKSEQKQAENEVPSSKSPKRIPVKGGQRSNENIPQSRARSPPSGKTETDLLGKVSADTISPRSAKPNEAGIEDAIEKVRRLKPNGQKKA